MSSDWSRTDLESKTTDFLIKQGNADTAGCRGRIGVWSFKSCCHQQVHFELNEKLDGCTHFPDLGLQEIPAWGTCQL